MKVIDLLDFATKLLCVLGMYALSVLMMLISVQEPDFELSRSHGYWAGIYTGVALTLTYYFAKDLLRKDEVTLL